MADIPQGYREIPEEDRKKADVFFARGATVAQTGNYDYAINWVFHQDATLEVDAALSGIMLPKGVKETTTGGHDESMPSQHLVAANVAAPHHQHFFNFRLDFDVDGTANSVHEINTRAGAAGPNNPALNHMVMQESELTSEKRAGRPMDMQAARHWPRKPKNFGT